MRLILGKNTNPIVKPTLWNRLLCWLDGGHHLYFNQELGGLWCYGCGAAWDCDPKISGK